MKERCGTGWCAFAVEFVDADGYLHDMVCQVAQDPEGEWGFVAGSGGQYTPHDEDPLGFHFAVGGWPTYFRGGGRIIGETKGLVERVRFTFPLGLTIEDPVEDDWVLTISEDPAAAPPVLVQLVAEDGTVLWSHTIDPATSPHDEEPGSA